jgi:hypothetical protein
VERQIQTDQTQYLTPLHLLEAEKEECREIPMEPLAVLVVGVRKEPERAARGIPLALLRLKVIMVEMALHRQMQTLVVVVEVLVPLEATLLIMLLATVALERPQPSLEHL